MAPPATEIDRLIEDGLGLYGEGDLDGALLLWEQALSIDPENAQANSYVDYVRMNYELLTNDAQGEDSGPFGIAEDGPEYQIEILPGEDVEAGPSPRVATRDDGSWAIGDEADAHTRPTREALESGEDRERQIFATTPTEDLVPSDEHRALATFDSGPHDGVSFEDATREYPGGAGRPASALLHGGLPAPDLPTPEIGEFEPTITPPFGSVPSDVQTPQDFGAQLTDVRRRDLGFVQPTRTDLAVHPRPASQTSPPPTAEPPELKMTLRTPTPQPPIVPATPPAPEPYRPDPHRSATRDSDAPIDPAAIATSSALTLDLTVEPSAYDSLSLQAATDEPAPPTPPTIWPRRTAKLVGRDAFDDLDDGEPDDGDGDDNGDDDLDDLGDDAELAAGDLDDLEDADDPDDDPLDLLKTLPVPSRTPTGPTRQLPPKPRAPSDDPRLEDRRTREMPPEPRPAAMPPSSTARTQEIPYTIQLDPRLSIPADPQRPAVSATGTGLGLGVGPLTRDFSALPTPGPAPGPLPGPTPARAPTPPPTP
ncbi:MAG TPA: hypothetical protein VFP84_08475, partial [Kofleriaceae bacterium]|nr:hypothetical protein [Kofleriaceae bacterium]